jgi:hypothetical protein
VRPTERQARYKHAGAVTSSGVLLRVLTDYITLATRIAREGSECVGSGRKAKPRSNGREGYFKFSKLVGAILH